MTQVLLKLRFIEWNGKAHKLLKLLFFIYKIMCSFISNNTQWVLATPSLILDLLIYILYVHETYCVKRPLVTKGVSAAGFT